MQGGQIKTTYSICILKAIIRAREIGGKQHIPEWFSNNCKKNITKVIILTNRHKGKQFDEPIHRNSDKLCPEMHVIRYMAISISVTKCPVALLVNLIITSGETYGR